jgi:hypothetical protein
MAPHDRHHEESTLYPRFSLDNGGVVLPLLATIADVSIPPAVTTPKDPGLPAPTLQHEETRPTQAPIR